jgi:predicted RecB family nuclease
MTITRPLFDAYLRCPTKCWLLSRGEPASEHHVATWTASQDVAYREGAITKLRGAVRFEPGGPTLQRMETGGKLGLNFLIDVPVSCGNARDRIEAVERIPTKRGGALARLIPIRFEFRNKLDPLDKLSFALDAYMLSKQLRQDIHAVKVINGDRFVSRLVNVSATVKRVPGILAAITALLGKAAPPELILNKHCPDCQFRKTCRASAERLDELSLLAGMSQKERRRLREKGVFTITQLAYSFRPRRRSKRQWSKREKYHPSVKALAIRDKKIHTVAPLDPLPAGPLVYLDIEGLPDRESYYLIGLRVTASGKSVQHHSLWADRGEDEARLWSKFLTLLDNLRDAHLIHYGSYETVFLRRMRERYGGPPSGSVAERVLAKPINLVSVIFAKIYFPTYSNSLKEIAAYLGFRHTSTISSGQDAIVYRHLWENTLEHKYKSALLAYNKADCRALALAADAVAKLHANHLREDKESVDVGDLKRQHPYGFKKNVFEVPDMDVINNAAYWDYQRERIYLRSRKVTRRRKRTPSRLTSWPKPNRVVRLPAPRSCPHCRSADFYGHGQRTRMTIDLKFSRSGIKRCITQYRFRRYRCKICAMTFRHPDTPPPAKYGSNLLAYAIYQNLELGAPQHRIDASIARLFGIPLARGASSKFKAILAARYKEGYQRLVHKLCRGRLLHVDETKISVKGKDGFVWVLTSMTDVAYFYTPTREGGRIQEMLREFKGVLVSDFYAAYDGVDCRQQKCLIHLIRDLNDALLKHPYDRQLKKLAARFSRLLKDIVTTIDRFGLKGRFLRKHQAQVERLCRLLRTTNWKSDVTKKTAERLLKHREKLFTFLHCDEVPWNNNNAEHAIKAFIPLRRTINGATTEAGLQDYLVLLSLRQTCTYRSIDFLDFLRSGSTDVAAFAESKRG